MSIIRKHDYKLKANGIPFEMIPLLDEHLPLLYKWNNDPEVVYWSDSGNFEVCTEEEVNTVYEFHNNSEFMKGILIRR